MVKTYIYIIPLLKECSWKETTDYVRLIVYNYKSAYVHVQCYRWPKMIYSFNLSFDVCRFYVVIRFFIPTTTANDLRLQRIFYTRSYPLHLFSYLNSWERASIPFSMFSAKQGNYWYHFHNVCGMTGSLTGDWIRDLPHSKPALYH